MLVGSIFARVGDFAVAGEKPQVQKADPSKLRVNLSNRVAAIYAELDGGLFAGVKEGAELSGAAGYSRKRRRGRRTPKNSFFDAGCGSIEKSTSCSARYKGARYARYERAIRRPVNAK